LGKTQADSGATSEAAATLDSYERVGDVADAFGSVNPAIAALIPPATGEEEVESIRNERARGRVTELRGAAGAPHLLERIRPDLGLRRWAESALSQLVARHVVCIADLSRLSQSPMGSGPIYSDEQRAAIIEAVLEDGLSARRAVEEARLGGLGIAAFEMPVSTAQGIVRHAKPRATRDDVAVGPVHPGPPWD
jgi:hypothetical protein